jgi:hypothetical protein
MRLASLTLFALLGAACASASDGVAAHPFVGRFADALAFVPHGMDSIWLTDVRSVELPGWSKQPHLELRCGRDLASRQSWQSLRYRGVEADDGDGVRIDDRHLNAACAAVQRVARTTGAPRRVTAGRSCRRGC